MNSPASPDISFLLRLNLAPPSSAVRPQLQTVLIATRDRSDWMTTLLEPEPVLRHVERQALRCLRPLKFPWSGRLIPYPPAPFASDRVHPRVRHPDRRGRAGIGRRMDLRRRGSVGWLRRSPSVPELR